MKNKTIVIGVCGGIAAYKACELVRLFVQQEANVHVMMTKGGQQFVTPLTFQTLTGNLCHTDLFNMTEEQAISHIDLADRADLIILAPATANTLSKLALGFADDIVSTVVLATKAPVVIAPSMNVNMWDHPATQKNLGQLKEWGYHVIEPDSGYLACGWEGKGRLPDPEKIVSLCKKILP